jgi:hypothetical protein
MDGSGNQLILGSNVLKKPNGLAMDYTTRILYFVDSDRDMIAQISPDGSNFSVIYNYNLSVNPTPVYLEYYEENLYFNDRREDFLLKFEINSPAPVLLVRSNREIGNIKVVDPDIRQPLVPSEWLLCSWH